MAKQTTDKAIKIAKKTKLPSKKPIQSLADSPTKKKPLKTSDEKISRKAYEKALKKLHIELVKVQQWVVKNGIKICIVFEGRDTAGKGGTIKAITERVSPRVFRVVALPAPNDREKSQMYIQRYIKHFPAGGEIMIFDRSWYNRSNVERVMGFCTEEQVERFHKAVPLVEESMISNKIILLKYWLEVSEEVQTERLKARIEDGRKTWKLSPMDIKSYTHWDAYTKARDDMFEATSTKNAPWYVVPSDDKKQARINIITHLLSMIPYKEIPQEKVKLPKRKVSKTKPISKKCTIIPNIAIANK
jgi:polyphosphate kinase 2